MSNTFRIIIISLCVILLGEIFWATTFASSSLVMTEESYTNIKKDVSNSVPSLPPNDITMDLDINLMIVAHPDDETLWGGAHLIEDVYYVVCVTCGNSDVRNREFIEIMRLTNNKYEFLGYPDVVNGYISNWKNDFNNIEADIDRIIKSRKWKSIVTHNPLGEYGHFHHKSVSKIVTKLSDKSKLFYFGRYYEEGNVPVMDRIKQESYDKKVNDLLTVYKSQPKAIKRHMHMAPYENFIPYSEW